MTSVHYHDDGHDDDDDEHDNEYAYAVDDGDAKQDNDEHDDVVDMYSE